MSEKVPNYTLRVIASALQVSIICVAFGLADAFACMRLFTMMPIPVWRAYEYSIVLSVSVVIFAAALGFFGKIIRNAFAWESSLFGENAKECWWNKDILGKYGSGRGK